MRKSAMVTFKEEVRTTAEPAAKLMVARPTTKYNKARFEYKESEYDVLLKKFTIRDITKTSIIIASLFVLQYIIYLRFKP